VRDTLWNIGIFDTFALMLGAHKSLLPAWGDA